MGGEVLLTQFGIASDNVLELIFHAIGSGLIAREEEGRDIEDLGVSQSEGRHAFGGAAVANDGCDFFAGTLIVEYENGANEIGTAVATVGIGSVAEATIGNEERLAAFDGFRIRRRADGEKVANSFFHGGGLVGRRWRRGGVLLLLRRAQGDSEKHVTADETTAFDWTQEKKSPLLTSMPLKDC